MVDFSGSYIGKYIGLYELLKLSKNFNLFKLNVKI